MTTYAGAILPSGLPSDPAYGAAYKSQRELVHLLMRVVSRGGNLALNLGGQPDGRLPPQGMRSALQLGEWLKANGECVYETRLATPHTLTARAGRQALEVVLTQNARRGRLYLCALLEEGQRPIRSLRLPKMARPLRAVLLEGGQEVAVEQEGSSLVLNLAMEVDPQKTPALAIALEYGEGAKQA